MSKANDIAWSDFFAKSDVLSQIECQGFAYVKADDIKEFREPRLMAKIDTLAMRPEPFVQHSLSILPVQNGLYLLFKDPENKLFYSFPKIQDDLKVEEHRSQIDLQTFDCFPKSKIFSESQAIDYAKLASLINRYIGSDDATLCVRGRLYSGDFNFLLPDQAEPIQVSNVQIEVDAGFETPDSIVLIEAKIGRRDDFNIRQLFYPYLQWSKRSRKKIRTVFLTYSNGEYLFTEFEMGRDLGEIELISNRAFVIDDLPVCNIDLNELLSKIAVEKEPDSIPFPQADDLNKIVDLVQLNDYEIKTPHSISEFFEFTERQSYYYAGAAVYLGFIERAAQLLELTQYGKSFAQIVSRSQRTKVLLEQMLKRPTLRKSLELLMARGFDLKLVDNREIADIIQTETNLTGTTPIRRAATVKKWLKWMTLNCSFKQIICVSGVNGELQRE
ncbi:hypothetical protein KA183_11990 [bacterium]|nr:hypothetical protein [bacterium]QQR57095.1 MAG: hypothetical protein IPG59_19230 [Candidatus Melainabacteria bacterium]